jgi:hypothetical protein
MNNKRKMKKKKTGDLIRREDTERHTKKGHVKTGRDKSYTVISQGMLQSWKR